MIPEKGIFVSRYSIKILLSTSINRNNHVFIAEGDLIDFQRAKYDSTRNKDVLWRNGSHLFERELPERRQRSSPLWCRNTLVKHSCSLNADGSGSTNPLPTPFLLLLLPRSDAEAMLDSRSTLPSKRVTHKSE